MELAAGEHPADAVAAGGERPERRAEVDPLGSARLLGQVPPAHVDGAGARGRGADGAEEVLPAGQRGEGVRGGVRLLPLVIAAGRRAVEVKQRRRRSGRQQPAHYGGLLGLGHGERRERGRCARPHQQQRHEHGEEEQDPARRPHHRARAGEEEEERRSRVGAGCTWTW